MSAGRDRFGGDGFSLPTEREIPKSPGGRVVRYRYLRDSNFLEFDSFRAAVNLKQSELKVRHETS